MDWNAAIEKHREALKHILAALLAMAGLSPTLPRRLRLAVLRLLRPAESATRRLIIALARGLVVTLPRPRKANSPQARQTKIIPTIPRDGTGIPTPPAAPTRVEPAAFRSAAASVPPAPAEAERRAAHLSSRLHRAVSRGGPPPARTRRCGRRGPSWPQARGAGLSA